MRDGAEALQLHDLQPTSAEFLADVLAGLSDTPKTLPCKYLYDAEGSRLFERICELPEYYPTRTECALLEAHAAEIAALIGAQTEVIEFGSGAGVKIRLLLAALETPAAYVPVDISRTHLMDAAAALAKEMPELPILPVCADYTQAFDLPTHDRRPLRRVGFFPGSTIGNFAPAEAIAFLARAAALLGPDGVMIVGVDLPKEREILEAAYDDAAGVTAAFNRNLLARINRELDADFRLDAFVHEARWVANLGRMEMHLVSRDRQTVRIGAHRFDFLPGETIHTENSHKYDLATFAGMAGEAGFRIARSWTDADDLFAIHALVAG